MTTGGHFAYLKIAEGCDKRCTYCIIPKVRGSFRSVPMDVLVKEASELAEGGVKELILVAQETTVYGKDLYGEKSLPRLLRELCRIDVYKRQICTRSSSFNAISRELLMDSRCSISAFVSRVSWDKAS